MAPISFKEICVKYVEWVSRNPQTTSEIEIAAKWMSYFLAGRISDSAVMSELVYSVSNLVVLFNDIIIKRSHTFHNFGSADKLKTWLTVLEYCEVFIEVSTFHFWGSTSRWIVIGLIQTVKCIARLALFYHYKEHIIQNPPMARLRRNEINNPAFNISPEGFSLKSGRVIRTVKAAAPTSYRTWSPPDLSNCSEDAVLTNHQMLGEMLFITKPMAHLVTMYCFGTNDWRPWLVAFSMDLTSMQLLKSNGRNVMSQRQRIELSRRQVSLLLYLLRSPFYEAQTRDRLWQLLSPAFSIPLLGTVLRSLRDYIPHWQQTYFYMWSA